MTELPTLTRGKGRSVVQALETLEGLGGVQLDPRLVRLFVSECRQRPEVLRQP